MGNPGRIVAHAKSRRCAIQPMHRGAGRLGGDWRDRHGACLLSTSASGWPCPDAGQAMPIKQDSAGNGGGEARSGRFRHPPSVASMRMRDCR